MTNTTVRGSLKAIIMVGGDLAKYCMVGNFRGVQIFVDYVHPAYP